MDTLLANYGSDEEDTDSPPRLPNPVVETASIAAPSWSRQYIFGSLPPPRNSAPESSLWDNEDELVKPLNRNAGGHTGGVPERATAGASFLTALPRPKNFTPEDTDWGEPLTRSAETPRDHPYRPAIDGKAEKKRGGSLVSDDPLPPRHNSAALPSGFFSDSERPSHDDDIPGRLTGKSSPASVKSLFEKLPPPSSTSITKPRKVVKFRPPINLALLETSEEEDLERSRKMAKVSQESDRATKPNGGGLAALLPPPKNNLGAGAALGGGGAHGGRRTIMETEPDAHKLGKVINSNSRNDGHEESSGNSDKADVKRPEPMVSNYGYGIEFSAQSRDGSYAQPDSRYYEPPLRNSGDLHIENKFVSDGGYLVGYEHDIQSWQYPEASAFGSGSQPTLDQRGAPNVLAEIMKKEKRKGRDELPPEMIEVKQADLTGGPKLREDQLRTTGIAFGPSYKPASSTKDKPSKLHRRKHQLGALYFDMKQNEMNLLDRRVKGSLTKAETQAKYGW